MEISSNPNRELERSILQVPDIVQVPDDMISWAHQFQEAMMMYSCAIREVKTRLEVLNDELSVRNQRNPIEMIKSRVKKTDQHHREASAARIPGVSRLHDGESE